jgi:homoserine dehydrogenase
MAVRVGLIGFGTVGQSVARLLTSGRDDRARLVRVCTRPDGRARPDWLSPSVGWSDRFESLLESDIDVVVELVGGINPAHEWVQRALLARKSVVTANKHLVAEHGPELASIAARQHRSFRFEGAVAGGVPVVRAVQDGLAGDRLVRIAGILNGTCNYILTRMESERLSFADALAEAQARGYAETDPAADVDGIDARAKLAILCGIGFGIRVRPADIPCDSIAGVTWESLKRAHASGCTIRQVSIARRCGEARLGMTASVGPALVPLDGPFARALGCQNVIVVNGEVGGETVFSGQGAGGDPTAVAVVSDVLAIASSRPSRNWDLAPIAASATSRTWGLAPFPTSPHHERTE